MKKLFIFSAFAVIGITVISSCKKSISSSLSSGPNAHMSATINGASFSGSFCYDTLESGLMEIYGYKYNGGTTTPYPLLGIVIGVYTGVGTYSLGFVGSALNNYGYIDSSVAATPACQYGTVTITSVSPNLVGTFSFTCPDSTKVTGGTFTATNR